MPGYLARYHTVVDGWLQALVRVRLPQNALKNANLLCNDHEEGGNAVSGGSGE